jgi:hypothetical protein
MTSKTMEHDGGLATALPVKSMAGWPVGCAGINHCHLHSALLLSPKIFQRTALTSLSSLKVAGIDTNSSLL